MEKMILWLNYPINPKILNHELVEAYNIVCPDVKGVELVPKFRNSPISDSPVPMPPQKTPIASKEWMEKIIYKPPSRTKRNQSTLLKNLSRLYTGVVLAAVGELQRVRLDGICGPKWTTGAGIV
ncbi:hypothetical protein KIL84_007753 [Mauremys mutica]|uniref:Uncharacterized protein n=1 Tax=Mauremys mutica TaxID=74926 RepID=A0A9D3X3P6_9SAUR|nr:hypothetical protein KIL84_007753 [Mauremys mutica]